ncbi:MAG: nitrous oxide reductase family maturation protein NosD [Chloroflexi bacterium]|nr:nitrous oxide reductase family maturation protein NosD [Chloroflexota bacterium]
MKLRIAILVFSALALISISRAHAQTANLSHAPALVVSPTGPFTTIQSALDAARPGDHIRVERGVYAGPIIVTKSVTLEGENFPVIDNGGDGTVVTLDAPGAILRGFELRGSGVEPDRDHSGIAVNASRVIVENNRLREVLFGIFVAKASDVIVRGNDISSKSEYDTGRQGDAIRLWYSPRAVVENNYVHHARDLIAWYASDVIIRNNRVEHSRYGVHLMYCDHAVIEHNRIFDNSVGIYTMYSNDILLRENFIRGTRGPSGYALGFKDADNVRATNNVLVDNRGGFFLDNTPVTPQGEGLFRDNILAFNDVGAILMPAVRGANFEHNTFWENVEQVAIQGSGKLVGNHWNENFWSDYAGYDANGDGQGDLAYRSDRFFEGMADRIPTLRALIYSPVAQAIEFAGSAFPIVKPQPKMSDPKPAMQAAPIPGFALPTRDGAGAMTGAAIALLLFGIVSGAFSVIASKAKQSPTETRRVFGNPSGLSASVRVENFSKQYGKVRAIENVSFDARPGEALALWGANGAGKTTLLKAILGLIDYRGKILVADFDAARAGKQARANIGYVPQEATFYDLNVQATLEFYARLKKADPARVPVLLERVGLAEHARKPVPALSGGLKQRLALAVALLSDPPILLLDEPTANLDTRARRDYLALLSALHHEGKTLIFASHRIEEVETLADRVLMIEAAQLAEIITPEELRARLATEIEMTLWVDDAQRVAARDCLANAGFDPRVNGRGTVIVRVRAEQKMRAFDLLNECGVTIKNFEIEN